eukprot:m51a1_g4375 putative u6 snrna-associated sm-like protein lsm4 (241) ;mRNA; f:323469-324509
MQIFVKTPEGRTVAVGVERGDDVGCVRRAVAAQLGRDLEDERLAFGGKELRDGVPLADYGMASDSTVLMLGRVLGGMLPLSLLKTAIGHPMLVELKNGETYNGNLVNCDPYMNISLRKVICTSRDGDKFWKLSHCLIRGNVVKYLCIPDEVLEMVAEEDMPEVPQPAPAAQPLRPAARLREGVVAQAAPQAQYPVGGQPATPPSRRGGGRGAGRGNGRQQPGGAARGAQRGGGRGKGQPK